MCSGESGTLEVASRLVDLDAVPARAVRILLATNAPGVNVLWSAAPMLPPAVSVAVCAPAGCSVRAAVGAGAGANGDAAVVDVYVGAIGVASGRCGHDQPVVVHVRAPFDRLESLRRASTPLGAGGAVAECSDGVDNDGDGAVDAADPGCRASAAGSAGTEGGDNAAPTALSWAWATAPDGDFLRELAWVNPATGRSVTVVADEPSLAGGAGLCRWWPHGGNCSHWHQSYTNNSAREVDPWSWMLATPGDGTTSGEPVFYEQERDIAKRLVSSNATVARYESVSSRFRLDDTYALRGDTVVLTTRATNLMRNATRATFLTQHGAFQLTGAKWHLGNKRLGSLDRNWTDVEACVYPYDGFAPMPSRACFSAATAFGDASRFSVGVQTVTPFDPDADDALLAYMDVPANPRSPTSSTTLTVDLAPGESRSFTTVIQLVPPAAPSDRDAVVAAMESAVKPYVDTFHATWGETPDYCPSPSVGFVDAINYGLNRAPVCRQRYPGAECNPYGNDTECDCWWRNGTRMFDVFNIGTLSANGTARRYGMPYEVAIRPGIQSSHLTTPSLNQSCEFDPNTDVMDPHQDAFWDPSVWANMSSAAARAGFSFGWGMRATEEVLTPGNASASVVRDESQPGGYMINFGRCVNFEGFYTNESSGNTSDPDAFGRSVRWGNLVGAQGARHLARIKTLVDRGARAFYLDSHISPGRFRVQLAARRMFPGGLGRQLLMYRESSNDVDMLAMGLLPWYGYGDVVKPTVWQPAFLADHSHLARLLVPDGEAFFGQEAAPPLSVRNLSQYADPSMGPARDLGQHRGNAFVLSPIEMMQKTFPPNGTLTPELLDRGLCVVMTKSWQNYRARMASYGRARGCAEFPAPTCAAELGLLDV